MTLTMSRPYTVTCTHCGGDGSYETTHPMWGSRSCPEAYIQVECEECEGKGVLPYDRDVLIRDIFEILNAMHEQPYEDVAEALAKHFEALEIIPEEKR